jgi:hypothetical protein
MTKNSRWAVSSIDGVKDLLKTTGRLAVFSNELMDMMGFERAQKRNKDKLKKTKS